MFNRRKALVPAVGLATAAVTTVAGFAPAVAAPDTGADDTTAAPAADPTKDGTFESCSAYFGFGKEDGVLDVVEFDVLVEGEGPDPYPTVENGGVSVVLVIENTEGEITRCVPEEVSEDDWDDAYASLPIPVVPGWPGPGHYAFPTDNPFFDDSTLAAGSAQPAVFIDGIGEVDDTRFEVVYVAEGYDLVDPLGQVELESQFYDVDSGILAGQVDPRVVAYLSEVAGPEPVAALADALDFCIDEDGDEPPQSEALTEALAALYGLLGDDEVPPAPITCSDLVLPYLFSSFVLSIDASRTYAQAIELTATTPPPPPTTPTTPTTTPAASPAVVTPRFTG